MSQYRIYVLDEREHVRRAVDIDAADDPTALEEAVRLCDGDSPVEVWRLDRFLCGFHPLGVQAQA